MGKTTTLVLLLALALPFPATAAARVVAPPGNSEADQYYETLPTSIGPRGPDETKKAQDAVREGWLGAGTEQALLRRGATGSALAAAVARTAPPGRPGVLGSSLASAVGAPEGRGLGAAFPLVLVGVAAVALAAVVRRRRVAAGR